MNHRNVIFKLFIVFLSEKVLENFELLSILTPLYSRLLFLITRPTFSAISLNFSLSTSI